MIGPEADDAGLVDGFLRAETALAFRFQGEIDHHDGVLLHDAHQENDADERDQRQVVAEEHQRGQQRADAGGRAASKES